MFVGYKLQTWTQCLANGLLYGIKTQTEIYGSIFIHQLQPQSSILLLPEQHFSRSAAKSQNYDSFQGTLKASTVYFLAPSSRSCDCTPKIPPPQHPSTLPIHNNNNTTTHATRDGHCAGASGPQRVYMNLMWEVRDEEHEEEVDARCLCFVWKKKSPL